MRAFTKLLCASALTAAVLSTPAHADTVLLDLVDPAGQANTPYSLAFTATDATTTISFAGYQKPANNSATGIGLYLNNSGANLLGRTWAFTSAASGSIAGQYNDGFGTGTNEVVFAGVTVGSYDVFSQSLATTVGASYSLNFLFYNSSDFAPSGFRVTTSAGVSSVPEPATWGMMLLGFGAMGLTMRYRRRATRVTFA